MTNSWKEWQGRTVDGKFALGTYLGGSEGSAVFRTRIGGASGDTSGSGPAGDSPAKDAESESKADAAIKLVVADGAESESPLRRWKVAMTLNHPNLLRILAVGRCIVDGREVVYAVEEFSEENLSQVLPTRALDADETRGTLLPVLAALEYVHKQGLVHGAIRPSNILGVENQVKLSSDSLRPAREVPRSIGLYDAPEVLTAGISPASDVWCFGMTMVEMLTQRVPVWDPARMSPPEIEGEVESNVPEPFRGIAQRCLMLDPAQRSGVREIADRLRGDPGNQPDATAASAVVPDAGKPARVTAIAASHKRTAKWPYLLLLAGAIAVAIFLVVRPRPSSEPSGVQGGAPNTQTSSVPPPSSPQTPSPQASSPPTSSIQAGQPAPAEQQPVQSSRSAAQTGAASNPSDTDEIVERATPQVAPSARRTISGKIKVRVRVVVNPAGNVTEAKLKEGGSSKYFARVAVEAARRWKFAPAPDANRRDWILLFAFTRTRTEMSAARAH